MSERDRHHTPNAWSQLWQLPVLLLSVALVAGGWFMTRAQHAPVDWAKVLDRAQTLIEADRYAPALRALERISTRIKPQGERAPQSVVARYHLLRGDVLYLGRRSEGWERETSARDVVGEYGAARKLGAALGAVRLERLIEALVRAGSTGRALEMVAALEDPARRQRVRRNVVERILNSRVISDARALALLESLLREPRLKRKHEVWAVGRKARILLDRGRAEAALDFLVRRIVMLSAVSGDGLGPLYVRLGQALLEVGALKDARRTLRRASDMLKDAHPLRAAVLTGLGRVRLASGNPAEAVGLFAQAIERFPNAPAYFDALLGRAEALARLNAHDRALEDYRELVGLAKKHRERGATKEVAESLNHQHAMQFSQKDYQLALKYLVVEAELFGRKKPAPLLWRLARTYARLARAKPENAKQKSTRSAAFYLARAADYFYRHAKRVSGEDYEAFGTSLWKAGVLYDQAGRYAQAARMFREYVESRAGDPRRLDAMRRLARAHQAMGQYKTAIDIYRKLIEEHPKTPQAYASLAPLARCYLGRGDRDRAEDLLLRVLRRHPALRPRSSEYQEALITLGRLYYRRGKKGDYEKAITRLTEALERYGALEETENATRISSAQGEAEEFSADTEIGKLPASHDQWQDEASVSLLRLWFVLADAYRKSAEQIARRLNEPAGPAREAELRRKRRERLKKAGLYFDHVIIGYKRKRGELNQMQRVRLRNSYFYRADCAYELGRLKGEQGAIALYKEAVRRYKHQPAALAAMIQIVNSYCELGAYAKARAANERAKWRLKHMPAKAFNDPTLPMGREDWRRWLESTSQLALSQDAEVRMTGGL